MKRLVLALSALSLIAGSAPALAAPCKDVHQMPGQADRMPQREGSLHQV